MNGKKGNIIVMANELLNCVCVKRGKVTMLSNVNKCTFATIVDIIPAPEKNCLLCSSAFLEPEDCAQSEMALMLYSTSLVSTAIS